MSEDIYRFLESISDPAVKRHFLQRMMGAVTDNNSHDQDNAEDLEEKEQEHLYSDGDNRDTQYSEDQPPELSEAVSTPVVDTAITAQYTSNEDDLINRLLMRPDILKKLQDRITLADPRVSNVNSKPISSTGVSTPSASVGQPANRSAQAVASVPIQKGGFLEDTQTPSSIVSEPEISMRKTSLPVLPVSSISSDNRISVMNYNASRDTKYLNEILALIKEHKPDLVCLQEVVPDLFQQIKSKSIAYKIFQVFIEEGNKYGTCILCKRETTEVVDPYYYDFPESRMGRRLVGCEVISLLSTAATMSEKKNKGETDIQLRDKCTFHILTTHLESLAENEQIRVGQFNFIVEATKAMDDLILAGDFSTCNQYESVNSTIHLNGFLDCWRETGMPLLAEKNSEKEDANNECRKFRVLYRSRGKKIVPLMYQILKTDSNRTATIAAFSFRPTF